MTFTLRLSAVAILGMLAMPLPAAELPRIAFLSIGFKEVRLSDLKGTSLFKVRAATPNGYVSVTADLNGDGKPDEARILQNKDRQIAYVVAVISTPDKVDTHVLSSLALSDVPFIAIDAVEPQPDLTSGLKRNGVAIFDLRTGKGEAKFLDGEEFHVNIPVDRPTIVGS